MTKESSKVQFIHMPTQDERVHLAKKETFLKVRETVSNILVDPNVQSVTFTSSIDNVTAYVPRRTVEELVSRVGKSLERDDTALGFNDLSWREDLQNLRDGSLPEAPVFQEEWKCKDGHTMEVHKGQGYTYYRCPVDGGFKWREIKDTPP